MGDNKSMAFMGMGFELIVLLLGAAYLGKMLDDKMGWQGYATMTLIILFFISWFYHLLVLLKRINRDDNPDGT